MVETRDSNNLIIYDTSFLIRLGRRDLGTLATIETLMRDLESKGGYAEIVPYSVVSECTRLFDERIFSNGLPTYSVAILYNTHKERIIKQLPTFTSDQRRETFDFWRKKSRKGPLGGWLEIADSDIITFTRMMAEKGKNCFVCAYDSDIVVTCGKLGEGGLPIQVIDYNRRADISSVRDDYKVILLTEDTLKSLYEIPETGNNLLRYLTLTRIALNGVKFNVALNVGESEGKKLEEGPVRRAPLSLIDINDIPDIREKGYELSDADVDAIGDRAREVESHFSSYLVKTTKQCTYVIVNRSRQLGMLHFVGTEIDGRRLRGGGAVLNFQSISHFLLDDRYMENHHSVPYDKILRRAKEFH